MTQTTDAALVERGRSLVADFKAADWCDCYPQGASLAEYATEAADTIEAQGRRIEALEEAGADKWWLRDSDVSRMARSIMHRLGHEPSMKELWARLERAEADRDRMMNALQEVQSRATNGKVTLDPRTRTIINRALSRIQPHRPEVTP